MWYTDAQWADMGLLLARMDPRFDRLAGLTALFVPMSLPGIDIRSSQEMAGRPSSAPTVSGGSSEVLWGMIGCQLLGLPRA